MIFKVMPEKEGEKELIQNGGIRFPKNLGDLSEQNYVVIQQKLLSSGFCNITCINMHDVTFGLLQKPGMVESITVNGEKFSYNNGQAITIFFYLLIINCLKFFNTTAKWNKPKQGCFFIMHTIKSWAIIAVFFILHEVWIVCFSKLFVLNMIDISFLIIHSILPVKIALPPKR